MARFKAHQTWTVLPHGPIEELADNLWHVTGDVPKMSLKRTMTLARLTCGALVIWSPIALHDADMRRIERWGTPTWLVAPNGWHRLDIKIWKDRYPEAKVLAPHGHRSLVEEVVPVDLTLDEYDSDDPTLCFERLRGVNDAEGVMLVRSPDGTSVVLNDIMFNMDRKRDLLGFLFTTVLGSAPGPRVSRLTKAALVKDKRLLREDFQRLAATPGLMRVIVAHEKIAYGPDARAALLEAATYL